MDLFQVAHGNAESFAGRYEAMCGALGAAAGLVEGFATQVRTAGRLSVNLRPTVLLRFLALDGGYHNVYEWADEVEHRCGRPRAELLRERLRDYFDRRMAFDRCIDRGEQIRYGALNLGNLGVVQFGDWCLVFQESFTSGLRELAYLRGDSLQTYLLPGGLVDEEGLRRDACPHAHRHHLAALKHGRSAATLPEEAWPALVCSRAGFIEALFTARPVPDDLEAARMDQLDYDLYVLYLADAAVGRLGGVDRHLVEEIDTILSLLEKHSIPLETLEA